MFSSKRKEKNVHCTFASGKSVIFSNTEFEQFCWYRNLDSYNLSCLISAALDGRITLILPKISFVTASTFLPCKYGQSKRKNLLIHMMLNKLIVRGPEPANPSGPE